MLHNLVPTATRCGPVALLTDPDALEALGRHPDAPRPDLRDKEFLAYVFSRRGYSIAEGAKWSDITVHTKGRLIDCWDLFCAAKAPPKTDRLIELKQTIFSDWYQK